MSECTHVSLWGVCGGTNLRWFRHRSVCSIVMTTNRTFRCWRSGLAPNCSLCNMRTLQSIHFIQISITSRYRRGDVSADVAVKGTHTRHEHITVNVCIISCTMNNIQSYLHIVDDSSSSVIRVSPCVFNTNCCHYICIYTGVCQAVGVPVLGGLSSGRGGHRPEPHRSEGSQRR